MWKHPKSYSGNLARSLTVVRQSQDSFSLCLVLSLSCPSISRAASLLPRLIPRGKHLNPLSNHLLYILTRKQHFSDKRIRGKLIFLSRPVSASAYYSLEIMRCASSILMHYMKLSGVIRLKQHTCNFSEESLFGLLFWRRQRNLLRSHEEETCPVVMGGTGCRSHTGVVQVWII